MPRQRDILRTPQLVVPPRGDSCLFTFRFDRLFRDLRTHVLPVDEELAKKTARTGAAYQEAERLLAGIIATPENRPTRPLAHYILFPLGSGFTWKGKFAAGETFSIRVVNDTASPIKLWWWMEGEVYL